MHHYSPLETALYIS